MPTTSPINVVSVRDYVKLMYRAGVPHSIAIELRNGLTDEERKLFDTARTIQFANLIAVERNDKFTATGKYPLTTDLLATWRAHASSES
jgi:hypothetical protein